MSKQRSELKGALQGMNLAEPTRIPKRLDFKAPHEVGGATLGGNSTQVGAETQDVSATVVANGARVVEATLVELNTKVTDTTQVADSTAVSHPAQVSAVTEDSLLTLVESQTQVDAPTQAQNHAMKFQREVSAKLSNGYTRVPNRLLMEVIARDLSRTEIKILLLVARLTISFQRKVAPLSKGALERYLGTQGNTVLQALHRLVEQKLLVKITGDKRTPNQFGIADWLQWDGPSGGAGNSTTSGERSTQVGGATPVSSIGETSVGAATQTWVENSSNYKQTKKEKKKAQSLSIESGVLREYFKSLKPYKKREGEIGHFQALRRDYSEADLEAAYIQLRERGLPGSGQACHSPMAYLSRAMEQVMGVVRERAEVEKSRAEREREAERIQAEREAAEVEIEEQMGQRERAFLDAFPTEQRQREYFEQVSKSFPMVSLHGPALRSYAVAAWWDGAVRARM